MSKSSTASTPKTSSQLPSKSAWARGPPANTATAPSTRPQSPAPSAAAPSAPPTHSRRPSTLGQGVAFKDGVGARNPSNAAKTGSSVTFGSIDDASAPISSSPAAVPTLKPDGIKSFGTLPATSTNGKGHTRTTSFSTGTPPSVAASTSGTSSTPSTSSAAASGSASTPKHPKFDVKSLFQKPSQDGPSTSSSTADVTSPANRSAPLPHSSLGPQGQHPVHQSQPSQMGAPYPNFRPQQNGSVSSPGVPRSPSFSRQMANGNVNGRPPSQQGGPPSATLPSAMPSPRMGPPHSGQPPPVPPGGPVPMPQWTGYYYYPGMPVDPNYYPHTPQGHWMPPPHMPQQPHPPQGPPGSIPGMPMSPRGQQPSLHPPGTPTMQPAMPPNAHPQHPSPSPHMHTSSLSSISSTPSTPASSTAPGGGISRLNSNASSFTPKRVVIKSESGQEVDLERFKKQAPAVSSPVVPNSPARRPVSVRIETEDAKRKRMAEEEAAKRKEKEAEESKKKEAEDKARREEEARKKEEAEVQKKKEEEERRKKEEEERIRKETEEKERLRKEAEEKERQAREAEEKVRKEEEERKRKEEETRVAKEADELAKAAAAVAAEAKPEPSEEGEVQEPLDAADEAAKEEAKDKVPDKASLRIDTSLTPGDGKRRPGRLDLSSTKSNAIPAPLPSALATARIIEDIGSIAYPEGISSPKPELNVNAKQGKFRYDRDFLLQFMAVCKEKPDSLPPLDAIGLEPVDGYTITRGGSQNHGRRPSSTAMPPPSSTTSRQPPVGLGISSFSKNVNPFTMGQFSTPKSSEERFAAASRSASMSGGPAGLPFGRPAPMVRSSSQGGPGGSGRTRSQRGNKRGQDRPGGGQSGQGNSYGPAGSSLANAMSLEPVAPLEVSANRWTPASLVKKGPVVEQDSPEVVDRKVRALLNKLTMERFDTISDQIIAWANKSEKEQDGRTLIQVIRLVFEKATDEATWSEMYARLCRKMMEQISPNVRDDGIKTTEGKPIAGGQLFRKYLLNRCQEDFERGWAAKDATAAAAATKATEDHAAKAAAEANKGAEGEGESALYSEEYYAAQKAKRQGLGLIKFIGELFKLQMLTERIMHECVKKLLGNVENPEEEEIESLCKLLTTVGQILDTPKARAHMDVYFSRMKELTRSANVNSRMQFMLQDVIELRDRKWIPRNLASAPTTIAALREQIEKEKIAQEKDAMNRTLSMSRGGSRRGGERGDHQQIGPDGWAVAGGATPRQPKAGDLSQFGKISKAAPMTFGPSSVFQKDKTKSRESTLSRQGSTNMFSMLNSEMPTEAATSKSSRPPSRKNSIDLGPGGAPDAAPQQRKRLQLLPRSVPVDSKSESTPAGSTAGSDDDAAESTVGASMSVEEANVQIKEDLKEFFSVRNLEEAEVYFTKLPVEHRHLLVDKLVTHAVESKEDDAKLVASLFGLAHAKNLCSPATFEEGFAPTAEIIDDVAIDAPKAFNLFAIMLKGAHLHEDEERGARLASKSMDSDKLLSLLSS